MSDSKSWTVRESISGTPGSNTIIRPQAEGHHQLLEVSSPVLAIVRQGQKRVKMSGSDTFVVSPGEAIAISGGTVLDVTNVPDENGLYLADLLIFSEDLFDEHATPAAAAGCYVIPAQAQLEECFQRCTQALAADAAIPVQIAEHRFKEMLLWLHSQGVNLAVAPRSLEYRLRKMFSEDIASDWPIARILQKLASEGRAMSAATLRRRLAENNTSIRDIITDVRLTHALFLLHTTSLPISAIAADIGYTSSSRFSKRFKARFGRSPKAMKSNTDTE